MSKLSEAIKLALLTATAISGIITASEMRRIARTEFEVTISMEQADSLARTAKRIQREAYKDMRSEGETILEEGE